MADIIDSSDLLSLFNLDLDDIASLPSVSKRAEWQDFADFKYTPEKSYSCENGHNKVSPLLQVSSTGLDISKQAFSINGTLVIGCPYCGLPVFELE